MKRKIFNNTAKTIFYKISFLLQLTKLNHSGTPPIVNRPTIQKKRLK